jgi:hypothetical protein
LILITSHETTEFVFPKAHPKMYKGDACVKFNDGITNGAAWYVIEGGMQDWSYVHTSDMEVTFEVGCIKYPNENDLESYWNDNKGALLAYITQVNTFRDWNEVTREHSHLTDTVRLDIEGSVRH